MDLQSNKIFKISKYDLTRFKQLKYLDLRNNTIMFLDFANCGAGVTIPIPNLFQVKLSYNSIETIQNYSFTSMGQLYELIIRSNDIYFIALDAFTGMESLKCLDLSNNRIMRIDLGSLQGPVSVFLHGNNMLKIGALTGLKSAPLGTYQYMTQHNDCLATTERGKIELDFVRVLFIQFISF